MPPFPAKGLAIAAVMGASLVLGACSESRLRLAPDFGEAVRQDVAAQIANPDAHYAGTPAPGSNGMRIDSAQERYVRHTVAQPVATQTSSVGIGGGGEPFVRGCPLWVIQGVA